MDSRLRSSFISPSLGRITGSKDFDSPTLVVNIQDLHCHPEVQRAIAAILGELDKKYALNRVYVEGGYGDVDTSWLSAVPDAGVRRRILDNLVRQGALTGAEYYSMTSGKYGLLKGIEDERLHKQNIVRLGTILENRPRYERVLRDLRQDLGFMQAKYFSDRNRRFNRVVEQYRQGEIGPEQYYCLLDKYVRKVNENPGDYNLRFALSMDDYTNIGLHCRLMELQRHLRSGKASGQLPQFLHLLKDRMPYGEYEALLRKTENFTRLDVLVSALDRSGNRALLEQAGRFPDLARFAEYSRLCGAMDPLQLVKEEKRLVEQLRIALSRNGSEVEVSFLSDFYGCFEDYLLAGLSAADYAYFKERFAKFRATWGKYVFKDRIPGLEEDFPLLDGYYAVNSRRNEIFLSKMTGGQDGQAKDAHPLPGIAVVVTGGFHSEGLARLLEDRRISYVTIMPHVSEDTRRSSAAYRSAARKLAKRYASEALSLTLPSCGARVLEVSDARIRVKLANGDIYTYSNKIGDQWMFGHGRTATGGNVEYDETVTEAVREAARMAAGISPCRIGYTVELVNALVHAVGERGAPELWGGNGIIWDIVKAVQRDPELENYLGSNINGIAQLPDLLQRIRLAEADRTRTLRELAGQGDALAPLLALPQMQAFWEIYRKGAVPLQDRLKEDRQKNVGITFTKGDVSHEDFIGMMAAVPDDYDVLVMAQDGRTFDARDIAEKDFAGAQVSLTAQAVYHRYKNTAYKFGMNGIVGAGLIISLPLSEDADPFAWLRENFFPWLTVSEMRFLFENTTSREWEDRIKGYIAAQGPLIARMADPAVIGGIDADNPKLLDAYRKVASFYYSVMAFRTPFIPLCIVKKPGGRPNYDILQDILEQTRRRTSIDQTGPVYDYLYDKLQEDLQKPGLFTVTPRDDRQGFEEQVKAVLNGLNGQNAVKYILISATFPLHATGPRLEFARRKLRTERYRQWNEIVTGKAFDENEVAGKNKRALPIALIINGMHCSNTFEVDADVEYVFTPRQKQRIAAILDANNPPDSPPDDRARAEDGTREAAPGPPETAPENRAGELTRPQDRATAVSPGERPGIGAFIDRLQESFSGIPDVMQRADDDPLKQAVVAFQSYRLGDALRILETMRADTLAHAAALARLRLQFPPEKYPPEIWNTSNVDLEEQISLFRALEHTLNVLLNWETLPSDQIKGRITMVPDFWKNDPMGHKKKEAFIKGARDFHELLLALFPDADDRPLRDPEQAEHILRAALLGILRGNRGDDLSRAPEDPSAPEVFYRGLDHRDQCVRELDRSHDIAFLTDNVGGETFSVLLEAWLLLRSGKNVTIYSKQEPSLFSDTTLRDLRFSIEVFDELLEAYFGEGVPTLTGFLGDTFGAKQLSFPYVSHGEKLDGHNVIPYDFGFLERHDTAIVIGELQYGGFVRQEVRRRLGTLAGYTDTCANLNPFANTTLVFLKSRKNPREILWAPPQEGATRGELICQVFSCEQKESGRNVPPGAPVMSAKDDNLALVTRMANEGRSALEIALKIMSLETRERMESPRDFIDGHTRKGGARLVVLVTLAGRALGGIIALPVFLLSAITLDRFGTLRLGRKSMYLGGKIAGGTAQVILDTVSFSRLTREVGRFGAASIDPDGRVHVFVKFVSGTPEQNREFGIRPEDLRNIGLGNMFAHTRSGSLLVFVPEGQSADRAAESFRSAVKGLGERQADAPLFKRLKTVLGDLEQAAPAGMKDLDLKLRQLAPGIHIVEGEGETRYVDGEMIVPLGRFGSDLSRDSVAHTLGELARERRERERALEAARYFGVSAETPQELVKKLSCFRGATAGNIVIPGAIFDGLDAEAVRRTGEFFRQHEIDVFVDLGKDVRARERYRAEFQYNGFAGYVHTDAQGTVNIFRYNIGRGAFEAAVRPEVLKLDGDSGNCDEIAGRLMNDRAIPLLVDLSEWTAGNRPRDLSQVAAISALVIDLLRKDAMEQSLKDQIKGFDPQYLKGVLAAA